MCQNEIAKLEAEVSLWNCYCCCWSTISV